MSVLLWVVAGLLAAVFLVAGLMKLARSREQLASSGLAWTEDVSATTVKVIGVLEVLAAIGLVVPPLVDVAPVLAPLAAIGLALVMAGAVVVHARRGERQMLVGNVVLLALAVLVAVGRLGPNAF